MGSRKESSSKSKSKDKKKDKDKKSKKHHKHKDTKHKKKDKHKQKDFSPSLSPASSDSAPELNINAPIEKELPPNTEDVLPKPQVVREDWMTKPLPRPHAQNLADAVEGTKKEDKGWGVALDEAKDAKMAQRNTTTSRLPSVVGDGGASWRLKALKRMQERAKNDGHSLKDIAASRGVDLAKLTQQVTEAPAARAHAHLSESRRRAARHGGKRDKKDDKKSSHYLDDVRSDRSMMRRPKLNDSLTWGGGRGRPKPTTGQREVDPAVKSAAAAMNSFQNDGSFMDSFNEMQIEGAQKDANDQMNADHEDDPMDEEPQDGVRHQKATMGKLMDRRTAQPTDNESAAELLRRQLMGGSKVDVPAQIQQSKEQVVQLPLVDSSGRAVPGAFGRDVFDDSSRAKRSRSDNFAADGSRKRYFDDDDVDLKSLVKRSKHGDDAIDMDRHMAMSITKNARYKTKNFDADAEYDFDVGIDLAHKKKKKRNETLEQQRDRAKRGQIRDYRRLTAIEESCVFCFSCPKRPKHLVVSIATTVYLRLPSKGRLVPGHCMIVPAEHVPSSRQVDEDVWTEMRNFKKAFIQMCMAQGKEAIFMETATRLTDHKRHAYVECIPVSRKVMSKAPLYFKKGIDDATGDWDQHHAKRCIETAKKGLRGSVPVNFPYFHVEFGLSNGFVHVIDDESKFDVNFGRKVLCGLLKLPAEAMHMKDRAENVVVHEEWVADFVKDWAKYDWTAMLR